MKSSEIRDEKRGGGGENKRVCVRERLKREGDRDGLTVREKKREREREREGESHRERKSERDRNGLTGGEIRDQTGHLG